MAKGRPRGAVIFNDYTGENIEMSVVGLWTKKMAGGPVTIASISLV